MTFKLIPKNDLLPFSLHGVKNVVNCTDLPPLASLAFASSQEQVSSLSGPPGDAATIKGGSDVLYVIHDDKLDGGSMRQDDDRTYSPEPANVPESAVLAYQGHLQDDNDWQFFYLYNAGEASRPS